MKKILIFVLVLITSVYSEDKHGMDMLEVVDYIKIVEDSIELKVKSTCVRKILFDASPSGLYVNKKENDIIYANHTRRYYDKLQLMVLENYDTRYGEYFNDDALFRIKVNTTPANIYYSIPELKEGTVISHIQSEVDQSGYRAFYIINKYGTDYKVRNSIMVEGSLRQLDKPRMVGLKVKYTGYIYIPTQDDEQFNQFRLKLEVLASQSSELHIINNHHALIIAIKPHITKSEVAPR